MANANIIDVTDSTFQSAVLDSDQPVLVDFGQAGVVLVGRSLRRSKRSPMSLKVSSKL